MTKQIKLTESVNEAPVKGKAGRWRVVVAVPGQGSSGFYSEEVLKRDAEKIVPPGGQAFINHDSSRNPKDMIGTYPEGSFWDDEKGYVVAEMETFSHWADFVEEVGPHCGMSLYAAGKADEDNNVLEIVEDRLNGCDLVARPGLLGSGIVEKLYESAVAGSDETPGARQVKETKETGMEKEILEALEAVKESLAQLVSEKVAEEAADAQAEADQTAVTSAVEAYDNAVKLIDDADLLDVQVEALRKAALEGKDVEPLIEEAKAVKEAAVKSLSESKQEETTFVGRILGESAKKPATDLGKVLG